MPQICGRMPKECPLHVPAGVDEKGGPVPADGRQRLAADFPYDIDHQRNDREGARGGGQKERAIDQIRRSRGRLRRGFGIGQDKRDHGRPLACFAPLRALANDARWRGDGLLNLGRGCFYLFDDFGRQRDIAHAIGDLLTVRQAVLDELPKKFSLLGVLLLVKKLPGEGSDRIGARIGRVVDPNDQIGRKLALASARAPPSPPAATYFPDLFCKRATSALVSFA